MWNTILCEITTKIQSKFFFYLPTKPQLTFVRLVKYNETLFLSHLTGSTEFMCMGSIESIMSLLNFPYLKYRLLLMVLFYLFIQLKVWIKYGISLYLLRLSISVHALNQFIYSIYLFDCIFKLINNLL